MFIQKMIDYVHFVNEVLYKLNVLRVIQNNITEKHENIRNLMLMENERMKPSVHFDYVKL